MTNILILAESPMLGEIAQLVELDSKLMPFPWTEKMWQCVVGQSGYILIKALDSDRLVGFALFRLVDNIADLYKVVVKSEARGQGLGVRMISAAHQLLCKRGAETILLEVQKDNSHAINLYEKMGYKQQRTVRQYYSNGDDALIFSYALDKT